MQSAELPPVTEVLPHRPPVLLLDRVLSHDTEETVARVTIAADQWLRRADGSAPPWLALEYMAQCVAAHEGLLARDEGRPLPRGYLMGAHGLRLHAAGFAAGEQLEVRASRFRGRPGLGVLSHVCSISSQEGELLAEGRLSVALAPPDGEVPPS